jgi:hypothetical protein
MLLEADDIEFDGLPADFALDATDGGARFRIACPGCSHASDAPGSFLGEKVRCPKCERNFVAEWGEPISQR